MKRKKKIVRRLRFQGLDISIETDKGDVRHWYDPHNREKGTTKMRFPYGYIRRTMGADDEQIDCYVGPDEKATTVYVIEQLKAPDFKKFDELKVMLGFESEKQAKNAYLMHYNDERFFGKMRVVDLEDFKDKYVAKALDGGSDLGAMAAPSAATPFVRIPEPPLDVDSPEGVENVLKKIGSMKDKDIQKLSELVWGEGYQYNGMPLDHIRSELIGFLLDQRDLFAMLATMGYPTMQDEQTSADTTHSSTTSDSGSASAASQSSEANYEGAA